MRPFLFSDGSILNLWNNCRRKLCQSLPMQYMGLWLQVRFEDSILSWKTSTHFFFSFELWAFTSKHVQRRKKATTNVHLKKFYMEWDSHGKYCSYWFVNLEGYGFVSHWIFKECVCWIIHFELTIDFVYIHININDVLFFIHVEFASLVYVYAEKLQICSKVLLEVRFNMPFFCILVYTRVYFIGKSLPIQPFFLILVLFSTLN